MRGIFRIFLCVVSFTALIWLLRGFGLLTFIPGGTIWILIFLSIITGLFSRWSR